MSNRSDTEQIISDLFTAYRASPIESAEIVQMAMTALDERDVFVKRALPVAAGAPTPDGIDQLVSGLSSIYVNVDEDDSDYVTLYCSNCEEHIDSFDEPTVKTLIEMCNRHWKAQHT